MRKRIFTILLAVMVLATFMPVETFAAYRSDAHKNDTESVKILIPKGKSVRIKSRITPARSRVKHTEDDLDYIKQILTEYNASYIDMIQGREDEYYPDVLDAIMRCSDEFMEHVENAEKTSDLAEDGFFGLEILPELGKYLQAIEYLESMDKQIVCSKKDLARQKKELAKSFKDEVGSNKCLYSGYYLGRYNSMYAEYTKKIENVKDYYDYMLLMIDMESRDIFYPDDYGEDYEEDDYDLEYKAVSLSLDNKGKGIVSSYVTYSFEWFGDEYEMGDLFTSEVVIYNRNMIIGWVDKCLEDVEKYGLKDKKYTKQADAVKKQIKSEVDCNIMYKDYETFAYELYDIAAEMNKDKEAINSGDVIRLHNKMRKEFLKYKKADYSKKSFKTLNRIFNRYTDEIASYLYQFQLKESIVKEMTDEMDKVPTLKEEQKLKKKELQQLKNKRIKQLRKFAKNKKYDQKKAASLAKKGIKKIKAAKTKKKVNQIYIKYRDKIKSTRRK